MDLVIVGTVTRDRIVTLDGETHTSLGGILYNALTAARCARRGDAIRLVGMAGEDDRAELHELLGRSAVVDSRGLRFLPGGSNEVVLTYTSADDRHETLDDRLGSLRDADVDALGRADALLANLISGHDFTPRQLARMRAGIDGPILLDIQSLTLAPPGPDGTRHYRAIPDWRAWCASVDVLKGNETELGWFARGGPVEPRELRGLARDVLDAGPSVLAITLGARGVLVALRGEARQRLVPAVGGVNVVDSTGCGDAFASGFLHEYASSGDAMRAGCRGNAVAALVAATRGLRPLLELPDPEPAFARLLAAL